MYFVKVVKGRRRVPKIAIFVFLGAPSCQLLGQILKKFMNFTLYGQFRAALWVMLWGVDLGAPTLRKSMIWRGPAKKNTKFCFALYTLANGDSEIAVLAIS